MVIDWSNVKVCLHTAGLYQWKANRRIEPSWVRRVPDEHLWVVVDGSAKVRLREGWVGLTRGCALWMRPGWDYFATQNPRRPLRFYGVHFDLAATAGHRSDPPPGDFLPEHVVGFDMPFAQALLARVVGEQPLNVARRVFEGQTGLRAAYCFTVVLTEFEHLAERRILPREATVADGPANRVEELLDRAAARLKASPGRCPSVRELARGAGLSLSNFSHRFRRRFGKSPLAYERTHRWLLADGMLKESDIAIKEVAAQLGYHDTAHFANQFRRQFGMTPTQFRLWVRERKRHELRAEREATRRPKP